MQFEFEVEKLDYGYIENGVCHALDLGYANSSDFPIYFSDGESGNYSISGTKRDARVHIRVNRNREGKYTISCMGEAKKKKH